MVRSLSSPLLRNVFAVASGTAMAQVVVFAFSPLITRIYSPEVFGLQGIFLSLVSILSPLIALRYPMAIITAKTENEALRLARLSVLIAISIAGLLWTILLFGGQSLQTLIGAGGLGSLIMFLPLALICVAFQDVTDFQAARQKAFRLVGGVSVLQAFITNLARVLGGLVSPVAAVLVVITTLAPAVYAAMLRIGSRELRSNATNLTRGQARVLLKRHRDFPVYRMPTDMLNAASQAVPVILLAALFSPAAAGLYVLTRSVLNLPSNIIGSAVGNVLYARFAELSRADEPILPLALRSTGALLALAPIIIGFAWFAPQVFAFVFGEEWREAGYYAQWMSLWLGISFANVPAMRLAPVIKAQNVLLIANILILAARIVAIYSATWIDGSASLAVASYSVVSLLSNVILTLALLVLCAKFDRNNRLANLSQDAK